MKRLLVLGLALILLGGLLSGCGTKDGEGDEGGHPSDSSVSSAPPEPTPYPVTIEETEIEEAPERVVSLAPALTALVEDMGYGDRLVGRSSFDRTSEAIEELPDCGTPLDPDVEAILERAPDLLLTQAELPDLARRTLQKEGITLLVLPTIRDLAGMESTYLKLGLLFEGQLTGEEVGRSAAETFEEKVRGIAEIIGEEQVSMVLLTDMAPAAATPDTFEGELMALAGFHNAAADQTGYQISLEALSEIDPYFLLVPEPVTIPDLEKMEVYQDLDSVLYDRVLTIDPTALESGGARAYETLLAAAQAAYPELDFAGMGDETPVEESGSDASDGEGAEDVSEDGNASAEDR